MASAETNSSQGGAPPPDSRSALGGSPVAHEVPVTATGARTTGDSGKRELFKETTTTALVFPNGGVIRLSIAVGPGQLLFLGNPRTNREVVAQVTRKRDNPGSGFYVEVEFTEPAPDFWGIDFPSSPAVLPANLQHPVAELLQSAKSASGDPTRAPAATAAEVQDLVREVAALRAQLKSMQAQAAPPVAPAQPLATPSSPASLASQSPFEGPHQPAAPQPTSLPPNSQKALTSVISSLLPPAATAKPPSASGPQDSSPSASEPHSPALTPASVSQKLFPQEKLLPKPALDFSQAKPSERAPSGFHVPPVPSGRLGMLRLALLATLAFVAVFIAAWQMHWLPWTSGPTSPPNRTTAPDWPKANPPSPARPVSAQEQDAPPDSAAPSQIANSPLAQPNPGPPASPQPESSALAATPSHSESSASPSRPAPSAPRRTNSSSVTPAANRSAVRTSPAPGAEVPAPGNLSIIPPKLIKAARVVAPSAALRGFKTGNVTIDALVDESGHVQTMKVLSGPPSFYKAAMAALKRYEYEPARQNGKPVPSHVTVMVPFWFEP